MTVEHVASEMGSKKNVMNKLTSKPLFQTQLTAKEKTIFFLYLTLQTTYNGRNQKLWENKFILNLT